MTMRITTNMVMRNYQNNLTTTMGGLESARRQVETGMRFAESYEDPSAAAKAAILERRYMHNADYSNNVSNVQKWQDAQEDVVTQLSNAAKEVAENYSPSVMSTLTNGPDERATYAKLLHGIQETMVNTLNNKYGDTFVMAGNGGTEPPFSLSSDGKLLYRGLDVDDPANAAAMKELSQETSYVDLGFGLSFDDDGKVISSTAFNASLPGINVVGYGQTEDGTSKNLVVLAGKMAKLLEANDFDSDAYGKLWNQFKKGSAEMTDCLATLGTKTQLLKSTKARLDNEKTALTEQYDNAVNINPAEAITNYSWAMYAYNTALKVGTSIITPSLLDFLK